jgi:hypothetical protein
LHPPDAGVAAAGVLLSALPLWLGHRDSPVLVDLGAGELDYGRNFTPARMVDLLAQLREAALLGGAVLRQARIRTNPFLVTPASAKRGKLSLRFGKLVDRDTTPLDGSFNFATGHAICKKRERVISGGIRQIAGGAGAISHIWTVESGPVPSKRGWYVSMNSDLGGAARSDFLVVANCERK